MTEPLTLDELRHEKKQAEKAIQEILDGFHKKTGITELSVYGVAESFYMENYLFQIKFDVKIKAEI